MFFPVNFSFVFLFFVFATWYECSGASSEMQGVCPPVLDVIILFDTSGGNDTVVQQQKNWTIEIVRELPIHSEAVRVGLIQYTDNAITQFNLSKYTERADIISALDTLVFEQGDTKTGIALLKAEEEIFSYAGGARLKANRIIIVFTDGLSMDNPTKPAKGLRRRGVKIYTISVNSIGFVPEMLGIVGDADNIFGPTDEDRLKERLLLEVEHSRSCDVQFRRNNGKTTSSFSTHKTTEFADVTMPTTLVTANLNNITTSSSSSSLKTSLSSSTSTTTSTTTKRTANSIENSSEEAKASSSIEDIGMEESSTSSVSPTSSALFTVESSQSTGVPHQTNLTDLLVTPPAVSFSTVDAKEFFVNSSKKKFSTSSTSEDLNTVTTISSTPTSTTICITQPVLSTTTPSTTSATSSTSTTTLKPSTSSTFFRKIGMKIEKLPDPVSKFLGRDVSNPDLNRNSVSKTNSNTSENKENDDDNLKNKNFNSNTSEIKKKTTILPSTSSESPSTSSEAPRSSTPRFSFSTRVTFRPISISTTSTTTKTTVPPTTTTFTTSTTSTTTPAPTTTTTVTRKLTPTRSPTIATLAPFPTLLSMEKSVTLPLNTPSLPTNPVKSIKKKIRRIIKRRRNILSKTNQVKDKVIEVKHVPTPTTPPIRSTLRPDIIEEKEEEVVSSGVQCPMDILFVVDSSGSIARTYDTQKDYLTLLIKKVEPSRSHRVGLIQFAGPHIQKMEWSFDTHSKNSQLLSAIRSVRHLTGTTYIGAALELSLILLDSRRKHTETTVILISDGFSQDDSTQQAKLLRQLPNVKMYAISLNKLTNTKYLTDIVGDRKNLFINDESKWFEEFFTKKLRCIPTRR